MHLAQTGGYVLQSKVGSVINVPKIGVVPQKPKTDIFNIITPERVAQLKQLRYKNGNPVIDLDKNIGMDILYEVLNRIKIFDNIYTHLATNEWTDEDEIFFSFPEFNDAKFLFNKYIESYHDERELVSGLYTCSKCKSTETYTQSKQTRSGDEGETVRVICTNCDFSWTIK